MEKTHATVSLSIWVDCPHCKFSQIRTYDLRGLINSLLPISVECDKTLNCRTCGRNFKVNKIIVNPDEVE